MTLVETVIIRNRIRELFLTIHSLYSTVNLCIKQLSSVLPPDAYPTSTLVTTITTAVITRLVLTRPKGQEMRADESR